MTFREKVTRTELKALTESNPRRRLFAGVAAAEPSTQHHHSGYRKEWCLDRGGSERQKPNLVFCLLVHRQATMGRPESFHRKSPQTALFLRSSAVRHFRRLSFGGLAKMHTRTTTVLIALDAAGVEFIGAALRLSVLESATSDLVHPAKLKFQEGRATVSSRSS
jgi:hypothetical protein